MSLRLIALCSLLLSSAAVAQDVPFSAADIEAATYGGGDLPAGRSALTAKVQILLDRSGTSPGVIDGFKGGMSESAIKAFERRAGLPMDGIMDHAVWAMLQAYAERPVTQDYTITAADAEGLVDAIPVDYAEKAQMSHMGFTSIAEKLGEQFHMDERFIAFLNPGVDLVPGATIRVMAPAPRLRGKVADIYIDKATRRVAAYDANGRMLADYPATVGSDATPSPSGEVMVRAVALDPTYTYNPSRNFQQGSNDRVLVVPPGPNGPVGTVWIDLSKPTYGIHGTPTPSQLFRNQSYGCVRLTNWDARELAHLVQPGVTRVHFLEPGVTIADATGVTVPVAVPQTPVVTETTAAAETAADKVQENTTEELADPLARALGDALPQDTTIIPAPAGGL
ncbi:MAG: L,D-transpeptidase [Paracoccus sp. (in: a-proteobacteria)]|uniref:L,D-transpeptidase family protein n=1 Tax=Paracoccus sp. TaxID=267 RepID=UPI0026E0F92C|nr:L,D-transpeptidase [Paracoccus sp. (in: a-proteobacteria)]MDO5611813.1 L,D-transpeptidase [Paracoccus sp. (in: a-proteobacteria)]